MISPPSGDDALVVRTTYLRKRHARRSGRRGRTVLWLVAGAAACFLCIAGVGVLILGT